jgi:hypothetical protein
MIEPVILADVGDAEPNPVTGDLIDDKGEEFLPPPEVDLVEIRLLR